ncbi:hypothetical protein PAJ34TS1_14180 [Paenibacillus azoreducens]
MQDKRGFSTCMKSYTFTAAERSYFHLFSDFVLTSQKTDVYNQYIKNTSMMIDLGDCDVLVNQM